MSVIDASYFLGLMLGPSLGGVLYDLGGLFLPFLFVGGLALLLCLASYFSLRFLIMKTKPIIIAKSSFRGVLDQDQDTEAEEHMVMGDMLSVLRPEVVMSMLGLMVTSSSWDWYQSSIASYLSTSYHISASYIGRGGSY